MTSLSMHTCMQVRWGTSLGKNAQLQDTLWAGLTDTHAGCPMGTTAENLAADYSISRAQSDEYAMGSQTRWAAANEAGVFADEIAPMQLKSRKGPIEFTTDEHPRITDLVKMGKPPSVESGWQPILALILTHTLAPTPTPGKLPTTFKKDGVVTPASASGICDGAGALVLASEEAVATHGLTPLCELVSWATVGVDPTRMGIGPVRVCMHACMAARMYACVCARARTYACVYVRPAPASGR